MLCKELGVDPASCSMTNLDFKGHPKLFPDQSKMSSMVEPRTSYQQPSILLYQFSPQELLRQQGQWAYMHVKIDKESKDVKEDKKTTTFQSYERDKIYTLYSIVNEQTTVAQLYQIVFEKLYFASSLRSQYESLNLPLQEIWEHIRTNQKEKQFFYLKISDQRLDVGDQRKIYELYEKKHKLKVDVFIYSPEKTTTKFDFSKYTEVSDTHKEKIKLRSADYDTFKDSYTLDDLLNDFIRSEVLDEQDSWHCAHCKKHVRAIKNISLYKIPKFLTIHLKKLKFNQNKIPMITYPVSNLNMGQYVMSK